MVTKKAPDVPPRLASVEEAFASAQKRLEGLRSVRDDFTTAVKGLEQASKTIRDLAAATSEVGGRDAAVAAGLEASAALLARLDRDLDATTLMAEVRGCRSDITVLTAAVKSLSKESAASAKRVTALEASVRHLDEVVTSTLNAVQIAAASTSTAVDAVSSRLDGLLEDVDNLDSASQKRHAEVMAILAPPVSDLLPAKSSRRLFTR